MRILVLGAGAVGGYYGARLAEVGSDVTFLVRPGRKRQLENHGLIVKSGLGDATIRSPQTILAEELDPGFDLVVLACKAYDLDDAIASITPAIGPATLVLPLLNGIRHLDVLDSQFGIERVLGGLCHIGTTLSQDGEILHLNNLQRIGFGPRHDAQCKAVTAVSDAMQKTKLDWFASDAIIQEMWNKFVFLATLAAATCITRSAVADIVQAEGGRALVLSLSGEAAAVATAAGYPLDEAVLSKIQADLTNPASLATASMLRDLEARRKTEASHILGDMVVRAAKARQNAPLIQIANTAMLASAQRLKRESETETRP